MGEVAAMKPKDDGEPTQLALFEGKPVHEFRNSLGAGGWLAGTVELHKDQRVKISGEGYVKSVKFDTTKAGVTFRQHVIVVEQDLEIEPL
jgi:hypothetical protein